MTMALRVVVVVGPRLVIIAVMHTPRSNRRRFLSTTAAIATAGFTFSTRTARAAPTARLLETRVISPQPELYCGWPTVAQRKNGELIVVWSGGREGHVCPFGQVQSMTSRDNGQSWTWPRVLLDSAIDDRDAGVLETPTGALLVTTFSSLAYVPLLEKAAKETNWDPARLARWQAAHARVTDADRSRDLGTWMLRSTDDGLTWSTRSDPLVNSPHGPTALANGQILYVGKQLWKTPARVGASVSRDDGVTWEWLAEIPTRDGDDPAQYHELHAVQAPSGRVIAQIRNHNTTDRYETLQTESDDYGTTWSEPHSIGVWGYPSHLLRLRDGRLLMSYGHRRAPVGNQARLSEDEGRTWSEPLLLSADGTSTDLGYPSTVELADGSLLSLWYEKLADFPKAVLRQAHWSIDG